MFKCLKEGVISIMIKCYASDIAKYDRRTPDLSNVALHITQDTNSIEL